jgi:protocatechuate 3,4-dioxygenase, alpha subunit
VRRSPSQTVGPFYAIGLCRRDDNVLDPDGVELTGMLYDGQGEPIADGMIEIWDHAAGKWGRCGTQPEGQFRFLVRPDAAHLEAIVFARGLLRHQLTRIYLREEDDEVLGRLEPSERETLVARHEGGRFLFDIHMQGDRATVFFEH